MATRQPTHPSRRDNQSVSSNHSGTITSRGERSARGQESPAVESAVTRLLVAIKQLLESLTQWSQQHVSENEVSDVYVRLGNDFNSAVAAFAAYNIDMSELMSVPDDLRSILEQCLSEDATEDNLNVFLPDVRKIITRLLQGLRNKQSIYRRIVSEQRQSSGAGSSGKDSGQDARVLSSSGTRKSSRDGVESSSSLSRRNGTTKSRKEASSLPPQPSSAPRDKFVGGFVQDGESAPQRASTPARAQSATATNGYPRSHTPPAQSAPRESSSHPGTPQQETPPLPRPPSVMTPVPSHVPRFSLSDRPVSISSPPPAPPAVVVDEAPPPQEPPLSETPPLPNPFAASAESPPVDNQAPAVQNSLQALKNRDILERRASKRFSTYNISKMTGGSIRQHRTSMAAGTSLTPGELAALTEGDSRSPSPAKRERSKPSQRMRNTAPIIEDDETPPVPPLPPSEVTPRKQAEAKLIGAAPPVIGGAATPPPSEPSPRSISVFLQVGREVKKTTLDPGFTVSSLRVLFVDKFSYSPGKDNFPAIYIRDPSSGIEYELEDMEEVKEKCVLTLNIEPLDQIKQHIDTQMSSLSQDIKDLRSMVANQKRASVQPPMIIGQPLSESTPVPRPSERSFRDVARRITRLLPHDDQDTPMKPVKPESAVPPQLTGASIQPQMTGASVMSEYSTRIVTDLKTQFDEVQNLRRDLGIMRQLYTEFMKTTKESLGTLRTQTQNVRQLATAKVGGARAYIDDGKTKLDSRSQNVLTRMEELQDTVESIKDDVLKRNITPRPQVLKTIKGDIEAVSTELQSLKDHIQTVKPMWKKTWEEELQNIVEEQGFLSHQEEFLSDLLEDHKAVLEVYGHVEKVISLRGSSAVPGRRGGPGRSFKPPPPEQGHSGLSTVMLEIRGAAVDAERRMKAIAANEKTREKELSTRSDEFQAELTGFVSGKKLKMTGGAEEAERVRQRRNENTLKAMFSSSPVGSASPTPSEPLSPGP